MKGESKNEVQNTSKKNKRQKSVQKHSSEHKKNKHCAANNERGNQALKRKLYVIKDELMDTEVFTTPIALENDEIATRWFHLMLADKGAMKAEPKDFSLWYVGEFDTKDAKLEACEPKLIQRGA